MLSTNIPAASVQECSALAYQYGLETSWLAFYGELMKKIAPRITGTNTNTNTNTAVAVNGGYDIAWSLPGGDSYSVWNVNSGGSYVSNTTIGGQFALRGCVLNYRTTEQDMERLLEDARAAGEGYAKKLPMARNFS